MIYQGLKVRREAVGWTYKPVLAKLARYVVFGCLVFRTGKDLLGRADFYNSSLVEKGCLVAATSGLMHVMRYDHDSVLRLQLENQIFDASG